MFKRIAMTALTTLFVASGLMSAQGVAQASTAGFRLSQFGGYSADVCVHTDRERRCTGQKYRGHSEVVQVQYQNIGSFKCSFVMWDAIAEKERWSVGFSRMNWKECATQGTAFDPWIKVIAVS
jgi:hypothetical protein